MLNDRTDLHISRLHDRVTWGNATAVETLNLFTQRMQGMGDAALMAMKQLSQIVHRQAVVMGYGDAFFMLTVFYFVLSLAGDGSEKTVGHRARRRRALSGRTSVVARMSAAICGYYLVTANGYGLIVAPQSSYGLANVASVVLERRRNSNGQLSSQLRPRWNVFLHGYAR